jgi:YYY domain-containing protein
MVWQALAWYVAVTLAGATALGLLRRLGVGSSAAWAVTRVVGCTAIGYVAWLAGWLGLSHWWWAGLVAVVPLLWWGRRAYAELEPRTWLEAELVGLGAFVVLALLRLPALAVTATEKPMDLAILATLMRPGTMPPGDPWLAGASLPYYYLGFVPWVVPAKLCGFAPDVVFNLLVPTLAALSAQAAWALARSLGGSRRSGVLAGFLVVFSGTFDGWRQLFKGVAVAAIDPWPSSRAIQGTITEFPLFTFQLGDLHPHLLCVPLALVALFLARALRMSERWALPNLALVALIYGVASAANPWCALPIGLAILLAVVADESGFVRPVGPGRRPWLQALAVGAAGWLACFPFWHAFHPPTQGFGLVHGGTRTGEMLLFLGGVLIPLLLLGWELAWRLGGVELARRQFYRALWLAGMVVVAIVTKRVLLALALGLIALLAFTVVRGHQRRVRPALALTLVPLALFAFMELVYFKDPYGEEFYRMNTVFKASHLALTLLAVCVPVALEWLGRRRMRLAAVGAAALVLAGVPHLAAYGARAFSARAAGWNGLTWMAPGEADAVAWLRQQPTGSVLVEAIGPAYSDAARMSASSGVPAVLGWENHEGVWRGGAVEPESRRRKALIEELYRSGNPDIVQRNARTLGAGLVVVGSVERRLYPGPGLDAVLRAGRVAFRRGECAIVAVPK